MWQGKFDVNLFLIFFFSSSKRKQGKDCGGQVSVKSGYESEESSKHPL